MRRCCITPPSCRHQHASPCCKDCAEADCETRCRNDPDRCHCWTNKPPRQTAQGKPKPKVDREKIFRLHQQGLTQRDIAERIGCCRATVNNALHEKGVRKYAKY